MITEGAAFQSFAFNRKQISGIRNIDRAVALKFPQYHPTSRTK